MICGAAQRRVGGACPQPRRPPKQSAAPEGAASIGSRFEGRHPSLQLSPGMLPVLVAVHGTAIRALPVLPATSVRRSSCKARRQRKTPDKCRKSLDVERHETSPDWLQALEAVPRGDLEQGPSQTVNGKS